jgi:hypothetical protein
MMSAMAGCDTAVKIGVSMITGKASCGVRGVARLSLPSSALACGFGCPRRHRLDVVEWLNRENDPGAGLRSGRWLSVRFGGLWGSFSL